MPFRLYNVEKFWTGKEMVSRDGDRYPVTLIQYTGAKSPDIILTIDFYKVNKRLLIQPRMGSDASSPCCTLQNNGRHDCKHLKQYLLQGGKCCPGHSVCTPSARNTRRWEAPLNPENPPLRSCMACPYLQQQQSSPSTHSSLTVCF